MSTYYESIYQEAEKIVEISKQHGIRQQAAYLQTARL
jgi:hypothetical protein